MFDFDLPLCVELIQGSASRTWNCVSQIANFIWIKLTALGHPNMPRSRRRHHSRSRSRSRSDSHDKDREPKRRKIESFDSPHHRKSVSSESESNEKIDTSQITEENFTNKNVSSDFKTGRNEIMDTQTDEDTDNSIEESKEVIKSTSDNCDSINETNIHKENTCSSTLENTTITTELEKSVENPNKISKDDESMETQTDKKNEDTVEPAVTIKATSEPKTTIELENPLTKIIKTPQKPLTPKQLLKKLESEKKKQERQKERDDKLKKLQEIRDEKKKALEQQRVEKQREKDEKNLKRKEEEEEKKRKREEEKKKRQQEIDEKNREKQVLNEKKQKAAAAFVNFFVAKKNDDLKSCEINQECNFMPFEVKSDMRLAPSTRKILSEDQKQELVELMSKQNLKELYLNDLKSEGKEIGKNGKTWPYDDDDDDVMIVDDLGESILHVQPNIRNMRAKLLKFHENQRPPYFGTWRKRSNIIRPRKPFQTDDEIFNYDEDSDEDWEEEVEGESIVGSDEEDKEDESENDYEVDNDFFVPHGHLSEDEGCDEEDQKKLDPEAHKTQLKLMKNLFEEERKSKTLKIKPRIFGCIWQNEDENLDEGIKRHFEPLSIISDNIIIKKRSDLIIKVPKENHTEIHGFENELIPDFLRFLHGNEQRNRRVLIKEYLKILKSKNITPVVTKIGIFRQIKVLAQWKKCKEEGPLFKKFCWFVHENTGKAHNVINLQIS